MQKDHPPPKTENETPFERFQRLAQKIISAQKKGRKDGVDKPDGR